MVKLSIGLDERGEDREKQVRIRLSGMGETVFIPTNIDVLPEHFNRDNKYEPVLKADYNWRVKNEILANLVRKYEAAIFDKIRDDEFEECTPKDIQKIVSGDKATRKTPIISIIEIHRDEKKSEGTKKTYNYLLGALKAYMAHARIPDSIPIAKIDYEFLKSFDAWMEETGKGECARGIVMRNLRAVYNESIRLGLVSFERYPFKSFKIKKYVPEEVKYIEEDDFKRLLSMDFRDKQGSFTYERARDVLMASFYLCGMNLKDIYDLPKPKDGVIKLVRKKVEGRGGKMFKISIVPELEKIIKRYEGKDHMFSWCEKYGSFEDFQHNINARLRRISEMADSKYSLQLCRHTWATYCSKNGVDRFVISKSIGHSENDDVTSCYYINYDWGLTDQANRIAIDYALNGVKRNSVKTHAFIRAYR